MILAAGRGRRMGTAVHTVPKPLLLVHNKPLIQYHIEALRQAGIDELVINVSYLAKAITQYLGTGEQFGVNITYSHEQHPLETGGGIKKALPLLGEEPFIVVSADLFTDFVFSKLSQTISGLAHLVLVDNPDHNPEGDFSLEGDKLSISADAPKLNYGGIAVCKPELFLAQDLEYFPMITALLPAIEQGQVTGSHYQGQWLNVGSKEQLDAINNQQLGEPYHDDR